MPKNNNERSQKVGFSRRQALKLGTVSGGIVLGVPAISTTVRAQTLCVDPSGSGRCFSSIQDAVDYAVDGYRIEVSSASYGEEVDIDKKLTIIGDPGDSSRGPGPDPPSTTEFDIDDPSASGSTIRGFNLTGSEGFDINVDDNDTISDLLLADNRIRDEIDVDLDDGATFNGIKVLRNRFPTADADIEYDGDENIEISGFEFRNNLIQDGTVDLLDIDLDDSDGGYDVEMLISCNEILDAGDDGIEFELDDDPSSEYDLTVTNNLIDGAGDEGLEFLDNGGSSLTAIIKYNIIRNCDGAGIDIDDDGDASGITIHNNNIYENDEGLDYDDTETLDARNNFWGAFDGPSGGVTDPVTGDVADGSGDEILNSADVVRFDPFERDPVTLPKDCVGQVKLGRRRRR